MLLVGCGAAGAIGGIFKAHCRRCLYIGGFVAGFDYDFHCTIIDLLLDGDGFFPYFLMGSDATFRFDLY